MEIFFLKFIGVEFEIIIIDDRKFSLDRTVLNENARLRSLNRLKCSHARQKHTHTNMSLLLATE